VEEEDLAEHKATAAASACTLKTSSSFFKEDSLMLMESDAGLYADQVDTF